MPPRADYGIDAPGVVRNLAVIGLALLAAAAVFAVWFPPLSWACLFAGLCLSATAMMMLWGSKVGKLRLRDRLLDGLVLRGDERPGRGLRPRPDAARGGEAPQDGQGGGRGPVEERGPGGQRPGGDAKTPAAKASPIGSSCTTATRAGCPSRTALSTW